MNARNQITPTNLKIITITINERLNKLSSNEEPFNRIKQNYQTTLKYLLITNLI